MNWADFYLVCFGVGFALSVLSFLGGFTHLHIGRWHLPHLGHGVTSAHAAHLPVAHFPVVHGAASAHGPAAVAHSGHSSISPFDFTTLMAFLAWFGGIGYLLSRYSTVWALFGLGIATLSGLTGAAIVFLFISRVLLAHEATLEPADYEMAGVLSRVSVGIRPGGTGEIVYSQGGTRHACGARSEDGAEIQRGAEVIVTRYERGIAYVRRWEDLTGQ